MELEKRCPVRSAKQRMKRASREARYSILFVTSEAVPVPALIGWFGIVASVLYGFANALIVVKPNKPGKFFVVGLLILIFELVLGGWLLISPLI